MSDWETVTSSVPQGSVIGSLLLTIFINYLSNKIKDQYKLYVDYCQLIGLVNKDRDLEDIQNDISELQIWTITWQMTFNYDQCKVMHFGKMNSEKEYSIELDVGQEPHIIEKTLVEKYLGKINLMILNRYIKSREPLIQQNQKQLRLETVLAILTLSQ